MGRATIFNTVKYPNVGSNVFDLSHEVKLTCKMGQLVPVMVMDCVPGDKVTIANETLVRLAPMVAPVMHLINMFIHYFFVPIRLVWPNWEKFITTGEYLSTPPAFPYLGINQTDDGVGSLSNYLGLPVTGSMFGGPSVSPVPHACYQFIYNEYYRDENLIPEVAYELVDGNNNPTAVDLKTLRKRAWEHDYFTSALPFAQKGSPVAIPIGQLDDVPVKIDQNTILPNTDLEYVWKATSGDSFPSNTPNAVGINAGTPNVALPALNQLYADMSNATATATTINDLRTAIRLQEWLEKNARGGTRYIESNLVHFGVRSSDQRLDRPEYITGSKSPVVISEVLNTTGESGGLPQANMAGHALSVNSGRQGSYYCEEHGYIIGIMSIVPRTAYQQGIPKHFLRNEPTEWFWPSFANLGEQEIQNQELYMDAAVPTGLFGYIPRYAEYKYIPSRTAGEFMSSLNFWTMTRVFSSEPALNQAFIECVPTTDIFAVPSAPDHVYVQLLNNIKAVRKMPKYGTPSF